MSHRGGGVSGGNVERGEGTGRNLHDERGAIRNLMENGPNND